MKGGKKEENEKIETSQIYKERISYKFPGKEASKHIPVSSEENEIQ